MPGARKTAGCHWMICKILAIIAVPTSFVMQSIPRILRSWQWLHVKLAGAGREMDTKAGEGSMLHCVSTVLMF